MSHYTIDSAKMAEVQRLALAHLPGWTADQVTDFVLADWPEGSDHQEWLNSSTANEIASWVVAGLRTADPEEVN